MPCRSGWGKGCVTSLPMVLKQDSDITDKVSFKSKVVLSLFGYVSVGS